MDDGPRPAVVRRPDELAFQSHVVGHDGRGLEIVDEQQRIVVTLDRERRRSMAEDLDLAGGVRLHPEGRALGAGVAQKRSEHEPGAAHVD